MFDKKITEQLSVSIPDLPVIIGETSLRHDIDDLVTSVLPSMRFGIIDDVNTNPAFGSKIYNALSGRFDCINLTLPDSVEADDDTVNYIRKKTFICDALIAVGGGTINDLCKYTSYLDNKPYIVFPTSASMNGYLSANSSITVKGNKTTLASQLPKAVFCDFGVIANAPIRLAKSGLGDSLARPTAQSDWLLSHLLLGTVYDEKPFELLADIEAELFDNASGIARNDPATIKTLMKLLLISGIGMTLAGGSYPASEGEHMIAHTYNMLKKPVGNRKILHGEEIGITSLYMSRQQKNMLKSKPKFRSKIFDKNYLSELFGESLTEEFAGEFARKQEIIDRHHELQNWDGIAGKIEKIMLLPSQLENIIKKAELFAAPEDLGWDTNIFTTACNVARFTRDRFTFLDIEN